MNKLSEKIYRFWVARKYTTLVNKLAIQTFYITIYVLLTIVLILLFEVAARILTNIGWIAYYQPLHIESLIQSSAKKEDWRLTSMLVDDQFIPDSLQLWKPKPNTSKFNENGYVGAIKSSNIGQIHKSGGCVLLALGDSNTQGIENYSWPEMLNTIFENHNFASRMLNLGVSGYSSYQGLYRFLTEVDATKPNVILINFGWNDVAPAMNIPDSKFLKYYSHTTNFFNNLRLYRIIQNIFVNKSQSVNYQPRVSLSEYKHNLEAIINEAKKRNIQIFLSTRMYDIRLEDVWIEENQPEMNGGWRKHVNEYNKVVKQVAQEYDVPLYDMNKIVAEKSYDYYLDECHLNYEGALFVATTLFSFIQNNSTCK